MKFANATNLNRKSEGATPRDLRFDHSWEPAITRVCWCFHGDPVMIGRRLWTDSGGAHEWRTAGPLASLGMTKKGEGHSKERAVLNRGIFQT
jgi:hypothetical protein